MHRRMRDIFSGNFRRPKAVSDIRREPRATAGSEAGAAAGGEAGVGQRHSNATTPSGELPTEDESAPYGLKVLVPQPSDKNNAVDIVAVHGLKGHREKTWIDKTTGVNWLSDPDCLPRDIGNARVLSFGYNSASYFSRGDSDIQDFASELLAALNAHRKSDTEKQRPIIFICHSLGGLVFKQAIVKAHNQDRFYPLLLKSIKAVLFFATPHRGSDLAFWDHLGTRITRAASLGFSTNTKLSRDLQVNSGMLKNISEAFSHRGWDLKVRSFYETELMPGLNCRVVEKESATLGWGNELDIASPTHHGSICKFPSRANQRYQTVISILQDIICTLGQVIPESMTANEEIFMNVLNSEYEDHLGQIDDPAPGTCEWVLSHPKFLQWNTFPGNSLLWFTSNAGCGKSVIGKHLVNHFLKKREADSTIYVGYFFFMDGVFGQDTASTAISALLHQLCCSQPGVASVTSSRFEKIPSHVWSDLSALWRILLDSLENTSAKELIWVLDGLDECETKSLRQFVKVLSNLVGSPSSPRSAIFKTHIKVLMLSRPTSVIQQVLGLYRDQESAQTGHSQRIRLVGEDENESLSKDIRRFARWKIDELSQSSALPDYVLKHMNKRLVAGADFTFLWISLVLNLVEDATLNGISIEEVIGILSTTSLDDVYIHLLRGASKAHPEKTRKLLSLLLAAVRPLTIDEMCTAIEVDTEIDTEIDTSFSLKQKTKGKGKGRANRLPRQWNESSSSPRQAQNMATLNIRLHRPFDNHLRQLCGHFVRIRRGRVYFVHQTARSFITKKSFSLDLKATEAGRPSKANPKSQPGKNNTWEPISLEEANGTMLKVCVQYIKMWSMEYQDDDSLSWSDDQVLDFLMRCRRDLERAFFPYAALYWIRHYKPLRKQLNSQHDYLLQPGSKLFKAWIVVHQSCISEFGLDWILSHETEPQREKEKHDKLKRTSELESRNLRSRYEKLYIWAHKRRDLYETPISDETEKKFTQIDQTLKILEKDEVDDFYKAVKGHTYGRQESKERSNMLKQALTIIRDLEEERAKSLEEDPYLLELIAHTKVDIEQESSFHRSLVQEAMEKRGKIHEMLMYFGLFRPEEAGLGEDDFLRQFWQSQVDVDSEHEVAEHSEDSEIEYGEHIAEIDHSIPNWVKRYIRENMAELEIKSMGSPGTHIPGLSNPSTKKYLDQYMVLSPTLHRKT